MDYEHEVTDFRDPNRQMICEKTERTVIWEQPKHISGFIIRSGVKIEIERTPCHLGGTRAWFLCPGCGRRCGVLYPTHCRLCERLHYAAEHESEPDRALRRAIKHRQRYGQEGGGIMQSFPDKPHGMTQPRYYEARARGHQLDQAALVHFQKKAGRLRRSIERGNR